MEYPTKLKNILEKELQYLKLMIENREDPFNHETITSYYNRFLEVMENE